MTEVKWIKITVNMFDDEKIKLIQAMPEGDAILVVWIRLICLAGKCNSGGYVFFSDSIPYTEEMLSTIFNKPLQVIKLAIKTFQQFGMVEIDEKGLYLVNFEKHQNIDGLEKIKEQTKDRVKRYRDRQKALMESNVCQYCGKTATGYDHVIPTSKGGEDIDSNKVPCCADCNRIKNDKPLVDFLNGNRDRVNDILVTSNHKLSRHVTLRNVTNSYEVTQSNATDIDIDKEKDIYITAQNLSMTKSEYDKLVALYGQSAVDTKIEYARNYKKLNKNYVDLYRTLNNWLKKDIESKPTEGYRRCD